MPGMGGCLLSWAEACKLPTSPEATLCRHSRDTAHLVPAEDIQGERPALAPRQVSRAAVAAAPRRLAALAITTTSLRLAHKGHHGVQVLAAQEVEAGEEQLHGLGMVRALRQRQQ